MDADSDTLAVGPLLTVAQTASLGSIDLGIRYFRVTLQRPGSSKDKCVCCAVRADCAAATAGVAGKRRAVNEAFSFL